MLSSSQINSKHYFFIAVKPFVVTSITCTTDYEGTGIFIGGKVSFATGYLGFNVIQ